MFIRAQRDLLLDDYRLCFPKIDHTVPYSDLGKDRHVSGPRPEKDNFNTCYIFIIKIALKYKKPFSQSVSQVSFPRNY